MFANRNGPCSDWMSITKRPRAHTHVPSCRFVNTQDPAGRARIQLAQESRARSAAKAKALALQNANTMKVIARTKAAEDDDIMGANLP